MSLAHLNQQDPRASTVRYAYYCFSDGGEWRLIARGGDEAYDLNVTRGSVTPFDDIANVADIATQTVDQIAARLVGEMEPVCLSDENTTAVPVTVDKV